MGRRKNNFTKCWVNLYCWVLRQADSTVLQAAETRFLQTAQKSLRKYKVCKNDTRVHSESKVESGLAETDSVNFRTDNNVLQCFDF